MSTLEGPFSVVYNPGESSILANMFGTPSLPSYEVYDANKVRVAVTITAFEANQIAWQYNQAFKPCFE